MHGRVEDESRRGRCGWRRGRSSPRPARSRPRPGRRRGRRAVRRSWRPGSRPLAEVAARGRSSSRSRAVDGSVAVEVFEHHEASAGRLAPRRARRAGAAGTARATGRSRGRRGRSRRRRRRRRRAVVNVGIGGVAGDVGGPVELLPPAAADRGDLVAGGDQLGDDVAADLAGPEDDVRRSSADQLVSASSGSSDRAPGATGSGAGPAAGRCLVEAVAVVEPAQRGGRPPVALAEQLHGRRARAACARGWRRR